MPSNRSYPQRTLPIACDRDRISAARYAAEKLCQAMNLRAKRKRMIWISYVDSDGQVMSQNQ